MIGYATQVQQLQSALAGAPRIGAAIGILMATQGLTYEAAFEALSRASQKMNRKVRDLAEHVLLTGQLPT